MGPWVAVEVTLPIAIQPRMMQVLADTQMDIS